MSSTLSRRIRRIGLLATTFTETKEQRLVKNEEGKQVEKTITIRKPVRNREELSLEEINNIRNSLIAQARAARKSGKSNGPAKKIAA